MDTAMPIAFVAFMASCCPDVILCHGLTDSGVNMVVPVAPVGQVTHGR